MQIQTLEKHEASLVMDFILIPPEPERTPFLQLVLQNKIAQTLLPVPLEVLQKWIVETLITSMVIKIYG